MFSDVVITLGDYSMDIAPILNVIVKFVEKILETYLPAEVQDAFESEEA